MKKPSKKHRQLGYGMYGSNVLMYGGVGIGTNPAYMTTATGGEESAAHEAAETPAQEAAEGASMSGAGGEAAGAATGATGGGGQ